MQGFSCLRCEHLFRSRYELIAFTLRNLIFVSSFGDNFGLFEDETHGLCAVWVTGFESDVENPGLDDDIRVIGLRFLTMKSSWKDEAFSMRSVHSYIVSNISTEPTTFRKEQLIGKGSCFFLPQGPIGVEDDFKTPHQSQVWIFDLLDHCVDYDKVHSRRPPNRRVVKRTLADL